MTSRIRVVTGGFILAAALSNIACSASDAGPEGTPPDETPGAGVSTSAKSNPWDKLGSCDIQSNFPGDDICIPAPPTDLGFQVHWGPADYDDADEVAEYLLGPGEETNIFVPAVSGNESDIYFYKRQYRMRHGSHHLIVTETGGNTAGQGIAGAGRRLGGSQNAIKDNPVGDTPPENEGIGMPLKANAALNLNLHHYNGTEEPILREAWVNFWYVDASTVQKEAREMFLLALGETIPPNAHVTVTGERTVNQDGRILTTYGHRHSNNIRFTAYHHHGDEKTLFYEDYDWKEPAVLEYNTLTKNDAPDKEKLTEGGFNGVLELKAGDKVSWECEIINKSGGTIIFNENEAITSEMCILIGDTIDVAISPF
jgi:hypothetical protein